MAPAEASILGIKKSLIFRKHSLVETQYAVLGPGANSPRRMAFCKVEGRRRPGVLYVSGYFAPMTIAKANLLEAFCLRSGHPFVKWVLGGEGFVVFCGLCLIRTGASIG